MNVTLNLALCLSLVYLCLSPAQEPLDAARSLLSERLEQRQYEADESAMMAMKTLVAEGSSSDWKLWISCSLFYNPDGFGKDSNAETERQFLSKCYPFFQIRQQQRLSSRETYRSDLGVALLEYFTEAQDPFIKQQMASFFAIEISPIETEIFQAIDKSISEGRFTKAQLSEFMASSTLLESFAFYYRSCPENYGVMHPLYWDKYVAAAPDIPWLAEYVRTHPKDPRLLPRPNANKPAADVISSPPAPQKTAQATAAPDSSKSESTSKLWMAAGLMAFIALGVIWWLRQRTSRTARNK